MPHTMKTFVFIISLIAYFIYLSISSSFINTAIADENLTLAKMFLYVFAAAGILIVLFSQAAVKYAYASRYLKNAAIFNTLSLAKFRLTDRLLVYILPSLSIIIPVVQARSLSAISTDAVIFFLALILIIELLFKINSKTMKAYITDKGIVIRGIDLRLEIPVPSNYHNPTGYYPYKRILNFMDLNDRLLIEQSLDMGVITLKADAETLKQVKAVLLSNKVIQKKF